MKRFVILLAVLMLLPLNAFALQPLSEDNMGQITGQAGVSIAIDDVKLYQNIGYLSYTDGDGVSTGSALAGTYAPGAAGTVSIQNLRMMVNINAITHLTAGLPVSPGRAVLGTYALTDLAGNPINFNNNAAGTTFTAKPLTIDVGDMAVLSEGLSYNVSGGAAGTGLSVVGVRIGLPTVEIHQTALSFDVTVSGGSPGTLVVTPAAANSGASFGTISIGANTMAILDGFVEIAPH